MLQNIGVHEDWTATPPGRTPTQVLARYPKSGLGRPFIAGKQTTVQDLRPKALNALQPYLDARTDVIYLSYKLDPTQTANGSWDAKNQELGTYLATLQTTYGVKIVVIPWHEPEDDFSSGSAFVSYYNRVHDKIKLGSSAIKVKPCFMAYHWAPGSGGSIAGKTNTPSAWFTNLKMDDGVTIDVYNGRSFPLDQVLTEHPGFARWIQYLPSNVRYNLTERGWETPSSTNSTNRSALRASTMRREFDWLLSSNSIALRCDDYMIWSSPGTENAVGLIMDSAAEAEIDRFLNLNFTSSPPPDPTPPTPNPSDPQYQFGYQAGLSDGTAAGHEQGYIDGHTAGLAEGRAAGYTAGYNAGLAATGQRPPTGNRIRYF